VAVAVPAVVSLIVGVYFLIRRLGRCRAVVVSVIVKAKDILVVVNFGISYLRSRCCTYSRLSRSLDKSGDHVAKMNYIR
jgi:hypothetical protein